MVDLPNSTLQHPWPAPDYDTPVEIGPGCWWLRTRLPFALNHVNIWIIDDGDGWTLVDAGLGDPATLELWQRLLDGPFAGRPVRRLLVTHFHPDHAGAVGFLHERTGAPLLMARTEWLTAKALSLDVSGDYAEEGARYDRRAGLASELVEARRARGNLYARHVRPIPPCLTRLQAGDRLRLGGAAFQVIVGEGHAPEQVTLHSTERGMLIAADQILPKITPVVAVWPQIPDADPLGDFLASLERYAHLPDDTLVLPSHGLPFIGLPARLRQLATHHDERLARTLDLAREPTTAAAAMRGLFPRELKLNDIGFALGETLAHLNRLLATGEIVRDPGPDGAFLYRRR